MTGAKTIFKRIIDKELVADLIHDDDRCIAFHDINPQAPVHVLVIPRQEIPSLAEADDADRALLGHLLLVARHLAETLGLKNGFRVVINSGDDAGQSVHHLHVHLLGGRPMSWPPG